MTFMVNSFDGKAFFSPQRKFIVLFKISDINWISAVERSKYTAFF